MKAYMKWANEWRDKFSSQGEFEESGQQEAWVAGYHMGLEKAAGFVESFDHHRADGLGILLRAIGRAEVTGEDKAE